MMAPEAMKGGRRSSLHIANEFIKLANAYAGKEGKESDMTPMKLMKMVYIAHGYFLAIHGRPLIAEDVEAWTYGPVIPELYRRIKKYGKNAVTSIDGVSEDECALTANEKEHIKQFFDAYNKNSAEQLSAKTHMAGTPWHIVEQRKYRAAQANSKEEALKILEDNVIPEDSIKEFYKKLVDSVDERYRA